MGAIVYSSSGGRKYHFDQACKHFEGAQQLNDLDCGCDTYCTHRMPILHRLRRMSATKAAIDGKLPCLACVPEHLRELPGAEPFGHEPVWINDGYCGGCEHCGDIEEREVCIRCMRLIPASPGPWLRHSVDWPCTSAIVLGLAPRSGRAA